VPDTHAVLAARLSASSVASTGGVLFCSVVCVCVCAGAYYAHAHSRVVSVLYHASVIHYSRPQNTHPDTRAAATYMLVTIHTYVSTHSSISCSSALVVVVGDASASVVNSGAGGSSSASGGSW
jgi:hypothetical protein